jgi:hypothetical protein
VDHRHADAVDESAPLGSYATLITVFHVAFGSFLVCVARPRDTVTEKMSPREIVVFGMATQMISRLITKGRATRALRLPFTRLAVDDGQVEERPRGAGMRRALGELVTCPHCMGLWVAAGLAAGRVVRPREARLVAETFTVLFVSEAAQFAYKAAESRAQGS